MQKEIIPRESRSPVWVSSTMRITGRPDSAALITNISNKGCRIRTSEVLKTGEVIVLDLPRLGTLSAEVRWTKSGACGLSFIMGSEDSHSSIVRGTSEYFDHHSHRSQI